MSEPAGDRHSDEEFLDAVRDYEPASTSEVADEVGVARQRAHDRLRQLEADGRVTSKRIGNSLAWRLTYADGPPTHVNPADGFWEAEAFAGARMSASEIDDAIYGETET